MPSGRSLTKIEGSGSESESGSVSQRKRIPNTALLYIHAYGKKLSMFPKCFTGIGELFLLLSKCLQICQPYVGMPLYRTQRAVTVKKFRCKHECLFVVGIEPCLPNVSCVQFQGVGCYPPPPRFSTS